MRAQDLTGSIFSFTQLAVSSIFIENDPSGIIANPAKLGMALLSLSYDVVFIWQNYCFKRRKKLDIS
jgi:cystinosin